MEGHSMWNKQAFPPCVSQGMKHNVLPAPATAELKVVKAKGRSSN